MQVLAVLLVCLAAANAFTIPATTLVRAPAFDSAHIKSDRLGGNFAYEVQEGHAYAAVTPVIKHVATPVAVSHHITAPAVYAQPAPITYTVAAAPAPLAYAAAPFAYSHGPAGIVVA